nr:MAG TPA: hypothetical protein [Caudoviricetes sp.]DAS11427.1 MAG TPA: hypothetical protein [Caudoviricetes sp.]
MRRRERRTSDKAPSLLRLQLIQYTLLSFIFYAFLFAILINVKTLIELAI